MTIKTPVECGNPRTEAGSFRRTLGEFATGVTVITTCVDGIRYGLTSNSFASVSLDPPLVLWSIKRSSQSFLAFESCQHFSVNILAEDQISLSQRFARSGPDKFDEVTTSVGLGDAPVLEGVAATFECKRSHVYDGGDHVIILGEVESFSRFDRKPLLFAKGRYAVTADHPETAAVATNGSKLKSTGNEVLSNLLVRAYCTIASDLEKMRRLSGLGLTVMQTRLLRAVASERGKKLEALLPELLLDFNSSQNVLESLVALELVSLDSDRRIELTARGEKSVCDIISHAHEREAVLLNDIPQSDLATVTAVLGRITSNQHSQALD